MQTAFLWAQRSTCSRLNVGAVLAQDGRTLSHGYNGAPAGQDHCPDPHPPGPCELAVHSELNAIAYAARRGRPTEGAVLYCTHQPCYKCSQAVVNAGIATVWYCSPYRDPSGLGLLKQAGIEVRRMDEGHAVGPYPGDG